jgi:hypothetical protein
LEYLVSFIRAKLDKLDKTNEEWNAEQLDTRKQISTSSTDIPNNSHIHLGAPDDKERSLLDLMNDLKYPVHNLPKLLETFINKFRTAEEGYFRVKKEHMVIQLYPL